MTPLHHAVNSNWKGKNFEIVKLLIERGADAKAIDDTHHTPLHLASNKETAELLIDSGAGEMPRHERWERLPCMRWPAMPHKVPQRATAST